MTRLILRALNTPILILLVMFGVAIQTSLFASYPLAYLQPDVVLLAVIWCGLHRSFTEGGIITLILGNIAEVHSAAPQGLFLISYMTVYLAVRGASRFFVIPNNPSKIILTLFMSILWTLCGLGVLYLLGGNVSHWRHTLAFILPHAVVEGLAAYWIYQWLDRFDWVTFKNQRALKQLEDEVLVDSEGF